MITCEGTAWRSYFLTPQTLKATGSAGTIIQNSGGTTAMTVGSANTTNVSIAGGLTLGSALDGNLYVTAASETAKGVAELATAAEIRTGTDTGRVPNVANLKSALLFSNGFKSSNQTITAAGTLTIAHGLGANPIVANSYIECTSAENGFSVGDRLRASDLFYTQNSTQNYNYQYTTDATNIFVQFGANGILVKNKSTGAIVVLTDANWVLVVMAWV